MQFYIQDSRSYVGNCVLWWRTGGKGYTTHLDEAGVYEKEAAERICRNRSTEVMIPVDIARAAASLQVDAQRLSRIREADAQAPNGPA